MNKGGEAMTRNEEEIAGKWRQEKKERKKSREMGEKK